MREYGCNGVRGTSHAQASIEAVPCCSNKPLYTENLHPMNISPERSLGPTRTLMVVGFGDKDELESFKDTVFDPEKMADFYVVPQTNILFLIFYDVRESVKFFNSFKNSHLKASYTISKHELPRKSDGATEKSMQSSISFQFKNLEVPIEDNFIMNFLKQYGEIRELRNSRPSQKTIEFYDSRDARKAFAALNGSPFGAGEIKCTWVWDMSLGERSEYLKVTDEFIKRYSNIGPREPNPAKRIRVGANTKKNPFICLFDRFIGENILEIERRLK